MRQTCNWLKLLPDMPLFMSAPSSLTTQAGAEQKIQL